jgi:L-lactate dehydrogenase complex protein LldF
MESRSHEFKARSRLALEDMDLQQALGKLKTGFVVKRAEAVSALPEFEALKRDAQSIREHALAHLDFYLEEFETNVRRNGGQVHWAATIEDARRIIVDICAEAKAKRVTKGKSMIGEEIGVNEALQAAGVDVLETDLGEYIIQLADEPPSHIIAPAIHKTKAQITELFYKHHAVHGKDQRVTEIADIVNEAREVLREGFLNADVGITGANFLVAESGSSIIVTNEGNGDLTNTLPRVHVVTTGIDKVIPTLEDTSTLLRLLARSATGQEMSVYTTYSSGPKREGDLDGPEEYHVVLLDNGRSQMLGNEYHEMLRCIRCSACMNHCPVYGAIGGHAYGWVYPGPMGSVLTPLMVGIERTTHLPNACTLNGRCEQVCPMGIPLPKLLRNLRKQEHDEGLTPQMTRWSLALWAFFSRRPKLYALAARMGAKALQLLAAGRGRIRWLPLAGAWTDSRDLPAPQGETFQQAWKRQQEQGSS